MYLSILRKKLNELFGQPNTFLFVRLIKPHLPPIQTYLSPFLYYNPESNTESLFFNCYASCLCFVHASPSACSFPQPILHGDKASLLLSFWALGSCLWALVWVRCPPHGLSQHPVPLLTALCAEARCVLTYYFPTRLWDIPGQDPCSFIPQTYHMPDAYQVLETEVKHFALAGVAQWIECGPANQRVACSIPSLGPMPGLQAMFPVGGAWEATTGKCFSPSLSPSLPLSKNK